jgi:molybdate transport system substrate-binding protein
VILVQKGNPQGVRTLQDLLRPELNVGLGDIQACAIGRNCEQIFRRAGISEQQLADGVDFRSLTVNELGTNVAVGALDAAIVWDAVAANFADRTEVVPIPLGQNAVSTVAIGLLRSSGQPDLARQFIELLASPAGQAVFAKHHYTTSLAGESQTPASESAVREMSAGAEP